VASEDRCEVSPIARSGARSSPRLLGRDQELALVRDRLARLRTGRGGCILVEGEPGAGRSALLLAVREEARTAGVAVLTGAATELDHRIGARCPTAHRPHAEDCEDHEDSDLTGVLDRTERIRTHRPVLLIVDDLQWAPDPMLSALHRLARHAIAPGPFAPGHDERPTPRAAVLLIVACRPAPERDVLRILRHGLLTTGADLLTLGPLAPDAVTALVRERLLARASEAAGPAFPGNRALALLAARAGGNPGYLCDLADLWTGPGIPPGDPSGPLPAAVRAAIAARLDFLSPPARALLRTAAVLGCTFPVADLVALAPGSPTDLLDVLDQVCAAGLLAETGTALTFRHPLVRDVLYQEIPAGLRHVLHRQAADELLAAGARPDAVAGHLLAAVDPDDPRLDDAVVDWLLTTGPYLAEACPDLLVRVLTVATAALARRRAESGSDAADPRAAGLRTLLVRTVAGRCPAPTGPAPRSGTAGGPIAAAGRNTAAGTGSATRPGSTAPPAQPPPGVARGTAPDQAPGPRRGRRGGGAISGWPSLTPAEVTIAALVAEGRTNADIAVHLFVSRRTVESHVSHVLAKLGLRSRVELARDAGRRNRSIA